MVKTQQEMNYEYFMQSDIGLFIGEWIAVCDNKIIAHGKALKKVVEEANRVGNGKKFLLARVPSKEAMIF